MLPLILVERMQVPPVPVWHDVVVQNPIQLLHGPCRVRLLDSELSCVVVAHPFSQLLQRMLRVRVPFPYR